jgi:adenylosuccinate synthase
MTTDALIADTRQYLALKDQIDFLTKRQNEIKQRLVDTVSLEEPDDKGHRVIKIEDETVGDVTLTRQRRVSKNLDMTIAEDLLTVRGIKDTCIKMIPTLDEAAIMAAFYEGYLSEEDIDTMFPAKETYAFIVSNK